MQNSVVTNSRSSRVASYSKLKAVGIAAAALTMILGIVASRMIDDGGGFTVAESAAAVAFFCLDDMRSGDARTALQVAIRNPRNTDASKKLALDSRARVGTDDCTLDRSIASRVSG